MDERTGLAMGAFVRVTGTTDVKPGQGIVAEVNGKTFAVFNVDGAFHAIDNTCIHGSWRVKRETSEKGATWRD
jgi:nitrite reductase/ring-hydroxylating ferredoxin subunit